jgi:acetyltransferase
MAGSVWDLEIAMSVRNLRYLFAPRSVAVIGASERPHSVGATVLRNVLASPFRGPVYAVNPKYKTLAGLQAYPDVAGLPATPDLGVICTPAATVPSIIAQLAACGTRAAIILSSGMDAIEAGGQRTLKQTALDAARPYLLRILGPNCVGLLVPGIGLNASFAHTGALPGRIAFVSQSGALVTGILDWAKTRGIGFSRFVSLGESSDVDFGDILDYLASDPDTHAILLYMEDVRHARKFMSAARAAARNKPTLVLKAGRVPEGARAAASHTGALAGADDVYDAAIRRAGMLRVLSTEDLFAAVETLARARPGGGDRLAILTNGGGPGVMATDALVCAHGTMATLAPATIAALDGVLPPTWSRGNPVDIIGDAPVGRYQHALEILLRDPGTDAVLVIHAPTAIVASAEIARAIVPIAQASARNVLLCWLGGASLDEARRICDDACLPNYDTPEEAANAYEQMVSYQHNQQLLMQVPEAGPANRQADRAGARKLVRQALAQGRTMLSAPEAAAILRAYAIPMAGVRVAAGVEDAVEAARELGFPVALKILSPDILHKSDVGGVALDLDSVDAVRTAGETMMRRIGQLKPQARLQGFLVQTMVRRPEAHELIIGAALDPVFGPVILFGQGGIAVEVNPDRALALPPLNSVLAHDLLERTRVARLLAGYRNRAPADLGAICSVLVQAGQLVTDIPEVAEFDINPLLADSDGVLGIDARMRLAALDPDAGPFDRLAIRPYPQDLEQAVAWQGQQLMVRPIRPEDGAAYLAFFNALDPADARMSMFAAVRELPQSQLARFTQIDYDREMAFIATRTTPNGEADILGAARVLVDPDNNQGEFSVTVRSDLKRQGLGRLLMVVLLDYCRRRATAEIVGVALSDDIAMTGLARCLGFEVTPMPDDGAVGMRMRLAVPAAPAADR